ncbi:NADAR family protein [Melghirimyces algeriensis]|uniref:NADAR domain-containing protein n=1 Tax=Melghirimyces algeriensis TaxID=910412 RepID=A0A521E1D9_9BACL|nr:NADAR family protein [Melghirimyces algeriensis]SMO77702.1 hypothetical protein SAMN06264849_107116 [Melghirimyces algeriensis]
MSSNIIRFYRVKDQYGFFSNFAPYPIKRKGKVWPTSEHYFQAQKFAGTEWEEKIRRESSPMNAARIGRSRKLPLREDWEAVKDEVMKEAVYATFTQHPDLKNALLKTERAVLVEHTDKDHYWGDGKDGMGKNRLGEILMEVRELLQRS